MSLKAETFFALQCDFPECGELWEGYEFTYFADGPDSSDAQDDGWFVDDDTSEAYCSAHTITIECPPELQRLSFDASALDDTFCGWCEDHNTNIHLAPMPDTWENRLRWRLDRVTRIAHRDLDRLDYHLTNRHGLLGESGSLARVTDRSLNEIWERTCRAWRPGITLQDLHALKHPRQLEGTIR